MGAMPDLDIAFTRLDRDITQRFQRLRRELGLSALGLNLMVLQPGERGRVHVHDEQEEVYVVLEGELTLVIEEEEHVLRPDDVARVGPGVRRQVVNAGRERVVVLAVGGTGEHESRDARAWTTWDEAGEGRPPQDVPLPEDLPRD